MKGRCVKCGSNVALEESKIMKKNVTWVFKCGQCRDTEEKLRIHKCEAKGCNSFQNVQYLMVRNNKRPMTQEHPEYYCQKHLRMRAFQLEIMKVSGQVQRVVKGWW